MEIDIKQISGVGEYNYNLEKLDGSARGIYSVGEKAFLVVWPNTIEVRTDGKLGKLLREQYESVMESRYFGRGGIEIVMSGQLSESEIKDLIRLSYNLTKENQTDLSEKLEN